MRIRLGLLLAVLVAAAAFAGGSSARTYMGPWDLAVVTAHNGAGQTSGQGAGGADAGQSSSNSGSTDPDGSAKKGKGYCIGDSDGDPKTCPSHKKAAKKGKGWDIP